MNYMSQNTTGLASAINLSQIAQHPAEALAALIEVVQRQENLLKEHELRLDKQGDYIRELRFKEESAPTKTQADHGLTLRALLASQEGKMLEREARKLLRLDPATFSRLLKTQEAYVEVRPFSKDKRQNVLILRSKIT
jgi:hypothetical protein